MADRAVKATASAPGLGCLPAAPGASARAAGVYLLPRSAGDAISYSLLTVLTGVVVGLRVAVCPRASALHVACHGVLDRPMGA